MARIDVTQKSNLMILSPLTHILILTLFATFVILILFATTIIRVLRTAHLESQIAQTVSVLDTTQLKNHLQMIPISAVEIDAEVAILKADIITAAHKHHLTLDREETQSDNPFNTPQNRERLIKIVEKQKDVATRVG